MDQGSAPVEGKMVTSQIDTCINKVSLRVAPSVKDERVYAIFAKSLLSYITSVPNF